MNGWSWNWRHVQPRDILDAAENIQVRSGGYEVELTTDWNSSDTYLSWARNCLGQENHFGWDAAVCYAKRAACRRIDAFMVCNHLSHLRLDYPHKIKTLSAVGLCVPDVVHELVIDPRNELEHRYRSPTHNEAERAVQLCEMFLRATAEEAKHNALISVGWSMNISHRMCDAPGREYDQIDFAMFQKSAPMLLIDVSDSDTARQNIMILLPRDQEIQVCPLQQFNRSTVIELAKMLRKCYTFKNYSCSTLKRKYISKLKEDIGLASNP